MQLSKKERLNLINQYLILEKLDPFNESNYARYREALELGYTRHYADPPNANLLDEMPLERCELVLKILNMYRNLIFSSQKLNNGESKVRFSGFDGNEESENDLLGYAEYYVKGLDRFQEIKDNLENENSFNSHYPMLDIYKSMLKVYEKKSAHADFGKLNESDIKEILAA
ncbi:YfbU family protein [Bacillus sp. C1-1]|nr:YfbU family protein [Bacillus sp. C1-1]